MIDTDAPDAPLARRLHDAERADEARQRSLRAQLVFTGTLATIVAVAMIPSARAVVGVLDPRVLLVVAAVVWGCFELAALAHHVVGAQHPVTVTLGVLDAWCRRAAILAVIGVSGSAASGLWCGAMIAALVWNAQPPWRQRLDLALLVASYATLVALFCVSGDMADAWFSLLVALAALVGHTTTARLALRSARLRAEHDLVEEELRDANLRDDRERMARELHDGTGADVMALVLRLRRLGRSTDDPRAERAARAAREANALLDELRAIVWSLRNAQGTLGELGKLVDAACRGVAPTADVARATPEADESTRVPAEVALATLAAVRELVRTSSERVGVSRIRVSLARAADGALALDVASDGDAPSADEAERLVADSLRALAAEHDAVVEIHHGPLVGVGLTMAARIATTEAPRVGDFALR